MGEVIPGASQGWCDEVMTASACGLCCLLAGLGQPERAAAQDSARAQGHGDLPALCYQCEAAFFGLH